jgi:uncharacterized protein (DUF58 family)
MPVGDPFISFKSLMNTTELLKKVRRVEIKTRGLSQRLFSGEYHSAFKGRGMSFAEVRPYQFGDDVRFIDWNVTARYQQPYVKVFEEERELTVILMVDMSRSDQFGTVKMTKSELMAEICAVLSFSAITNNDKVGVIFFTDRIEKFIRPKKGRSHILRIIRELIDFIPVGKGTNVALALAFLTQAVKKRCITFVLSDFQSRPFESELRIAGRKHDLIGIRIYDPLETELPDIGLVQMEDAETGRTLWVDTGSRQVRNRYKAIQIARQQYTQTVFLRNSADLLNIRTDQAYLKTLHQFFKQREGRR